MAPFATAKAILEKSTSSTRTRRLSRRGFPVYTTPVYLLEQLAAELHRSIDDVPLELATDRLLAYLEQAKVRGIRLRYEFFATATLLIHKQAELVIGFGHDRVAALADYLKRIHRDRPQAATWTQADWLRLARLVLKDHRPKAQLYFDPFSPAAYDIVKEVDLPLAARQVGPKPPARDARRLAHIPISSLLDEATELVQSAKDGDCRRQGCREPHDRLQPRPRQKANRNRLKTGGVVAAILQICRRNAAKFTLILQSDNQHTILPGSVHQGVSYTPL